MVSILSLKESPLALATDQYELTMAMGFWKNGLTNLDAEFHMFFRSLPFDGGFVMMAGLETLIDTLANYRFTPSDLEYLATLKDTAGEPLFEGAFLAYLEDFRFTCDLQAIPEGTVVFPNETLVRVQGPILQAQLVESLILNTLNFQSLIATKAARVCLAADGDPVVEFGLRRAQGLDGALSASRSAYLGGCDGTSNTLAGKLYGIPLVGTHAHSWVMIFDTETEAFEAFAHAFPNNCVFLVDTYDSLDGVSQAAEVGKKLRDRGHKMLGVRLDSGDLAYFSIEARRILDEAGLEGAVVMASNELDEYLIRSLKQQGARIGAWGVGTKLVTANGDSSLGGVYKLAAIRKGKDAPWDYKLKLSEQTAKISIPGIHQVVRYLDGSGRFIADGVLDAGEDPKAVEWIVDPNDIHRTKFLRGFRHVEPLLVDVYRKGVPVYEPPPLVDVRERAKAQLASLDASHKRFENPHRYPVGISPRLNALREEMIRKFRMGKATAVAEAAK